MKKPTFLRQHHGEKVRLKDKWRRPKGLQSKLRLRKRGHGLPISVGYKSEKKIRGKVNGFEPVIVCKPSDLTGIDKKTQVVVIKSTVGFRKRLEIIKTAQDASLTIINYRDPKAFVEAKQKVIADKKALRTKKVKSIEEKVKKSEVKSQKTEEKVKKSEKVPEDTKEEQVKKEKDKVLTKRQ